MFSLFQFPKFLLNKSLGMRFLLLATWMIPKGEILDLCSISTSYLHGVSLLLLLRTDSDGDDWQKQLGKSISP